MLLARNGKASHRNGKRVRANGAVTAPDAFATLRGRIEARTARVGIIGLGYVGLPLARTFAAGGYPVLGFDVDPTKVAKLRRNESYIAHVTADTLRDMRAKGFEATDDFARLSEADAILICVPTPLTESREPDLTYVIKSAEAVAKALRPGQLVVLESTTYPGTTRKVVLPILEATGLQVGKDFFLAFSPEREDPGNPQFSTPTIPKVVGGLDERAAELACGLYGHVVVNVVPVSTPEVAEACKLLENTYRAVNIALVNELKVLYDRMGINVWAVIDAANTKPFGYQDFYPGPGLGGHWMPIDAFCLTWVARQYGLTTRFIELAGEVNTAMPAFVVSKLTDALNDNGKPVKGSKVLLLGMAYKKNVDDARESPGFEIMEMLLKKGARVEYNDPHIPTLPPMRHYPTLRMASRELTPEYLARCDAVVVVTDHAAFDWDFVLKHAALVVDTRNATHGAIGAARVVRA